MDAPLLRALAGVLFVTGLVLYGVVLGRFDFSQIGRRHGDHWVLGGALAISALAAVRLGLDLVAVVLWALAIGWVPVLLVAEIRRPRLIYDTRRWATVFPIGMDAVVTLSVGRLLDSSPLVAVGRAWTWASLLLWAVVAVGALRGFIRWPTRAGQAI